MNIFEKAFIGAIGVVGFTKMVKDPILDERLRTRGTRIRALLQKSETRSALMRAFADDPAHREVFARRPRLGRLDLDELSRLPTGTLGRAFADEMRRRDYDVNAYADEADDGTEIGYVWVHIKETHDFWHTVTGFDVDVAGEMGVQAFVFAQCYVTMAPVILGAVLLNTFLYKMDDRYRRLDAIARGWQLGRTAKPLFGFDWRSHLSTPLADVREQLGLPASDPSGTTGASVRVNQASIGSDTFGGAGRAVPKVAASVPLATRI